MLLVGSEREFISLEMLMHELMASAVRTGSAGAAMFPFVLALMAQEVHIFSIRRYPHARFTEIDVFLVRSRSVTASVRSPIYFVTHLFAHLV